MRIKPVYWVLIAAATALIRHSTHAQTSPQPQRAPGNNRILFEASDSSIVFQFNGRELYRYSVRAGGNYKSCGATLHAISVVAPNGSRFHPSFDGGITAELGARERSSGEEGATFRRLGVPAIRDSIVTTRWEMSDGTMNPMNYNMSLTITGRTLTIDIAIEESSHKALLLELGRCEGATGARIIRIPYLTLFNVLYSNATLSTQNDGAFTSMFFDWETTNASRLDPYPPSMFTVSQSSVRFGQVAKYLPKTDGTRNPLHERIYLTSSENLNDVLPNLPGPVAPYKAQASDRLVLAYGPPFSWILDPFGGFDYNYLQRVKDLGVKNLAVIVRQYQRFGADHKFPDVLPANSFEKIPCYDAHGGGKGGTERLRRLRDWVVDSLKYAFALHENYVDFYPDAPSHKNENDCARLSDGELVRGWKNCDGILAHIIKPSLAYGYADIWSTRLRDSIAPTWCYLDVQSAANPSDKVDYDYRADGAASFGSVLRNYRKIPALLREKYRGPIQGEGPNHFLYAGYFDDFEARLQTADPGMFGWQVPLLVDFDLLKMHPKSSLHGIGHCETFFASAPDRLSMTITDDQVLTFIATELSFGHCGLITKNNINDHTLYQIVMENEHVLPMQQSYANSTATTIQYWDGEGKGPYTASEYIAQYSKFDDIGNTKEFMGRVKVVYRNGTVVCVNRSGKPWKVTGIGKPGGWFTRNIEGDTKPVAGKSTSTTFTLRARNGWVGYVTR